VRQQGILKEKGTLYHQSRQHQVAKRGNKRPGGLIVGKKGGSGKKKGVVAPIFDH